MMTFVRLVGSAAVVGEMTPSRRSNVMAKRLMNMSATIVRR
jgi:hypothetical protein